MYTAAVYNYFNSGGHARKCRRRIPLPKPCKKKRVNTCKSCGRKFQRKQDTNELDTKNEKQTGNVIYEKFLLIWKYAKNLLSSTEHENHPQKCSFKIIAHKSYKKRSLHQEIASTSSSIPSQFCCKKCEKREIQKNKCKMRTEEHKLKDDEENDRKQKKVYRKKRLIQDNNQHKKNPSKAFPNSTKKTNKEIQTSKRLRGKKRQKCHCAERTAIKKVASNIKNLKKKRNSRNRFISKTKFNSYKKKRMLRKENRKKINRFASWQYMQHALSSVGEDNISNQVNEDKTPVYLTFEEYCLILEAIDIQGYTAGKLPANIEDVTESTTISTEDVATNTDILNENNEDASTNTEHLYKITEEVATNTEPITEFSKEVTKNTEPISEMTEELHATTEVPTETFDTINNPLSESTDEFDANIDQPSDTLINYETNSEHLSEMNTFNQLNKTTAKIDITIEGPIKSNENEEKLYKNLVSSNSLVNIKEIEQTDESNEEDSESKEQTEFPSFHSTRNNEDET